MTEITKIDDTTVALVTERRQIYGSTELAKKKVALEAELAEVNSLIAALQ